MSVVGQNGFRCRVLVLWPRVLGIHLGFLLNFVSFIDGFVSTWGGVTIRSKKWGKIIVEKRAKQLDR